MVDHIWSTIFFFITFVSMKFLDTIVLVILLHQVGLAQSHTKHIDFNKLNLQFEDASAVLKPEYTPLIYRLADTLNKSPQLHVLIRGHVCCVNRNGLAKRRAKTVRSYLLHFGVNRKQISIVGMRNSEPVVYPEKSKADELQNMRVNFVLK